VKGTRMARRIELLRSFAVTADGVTIEAEQWRRRNGKSLMAMLRCDSEVGKRVGAHPRHPHRHTDTKRVTATHVTLAVLPDPQLWWARPGASAKDRCPASSRAGCRRGGSCRCLERKPWVISRSRSAASVAAFQGNDAARTNSA
jgi:hypothetical protein